MKILLADDHALFRDSMHYILRKLDEQVDVIVAGKSYRFVPMERLPKTGSSCIVCRSCYRRSKHAR
jgi:DNA-binding NarL/FixJ family response regulator